jgi:hypothetical protein
MSACKRTFVLIAAFISFGLGLYAGGVRADIYACLLSGSPSHYCQNFADVGAMLAAVGSNPFYPTAADCTTYCY